jgi:hypothetical protein
VLDISSLCWRPRIAKNYWNSSRAQLRGVVRPKPYRYPMDLTLTRKSVLISSGASTAGSMPPGLLALCPHQVRKSRTSSTSWTTSMRVGPRWDGADVNAATSCCRSPKEFRCQADERGRAARTCQTVRSTTRLRFYQNHAIARLEFRGSLELPIDFGQGRISTPIGWLWPLNDVRLAWTTIDVAPVLRTRNRRDQRPSLSRRRA